MPTPNCAPTVTSGRSTARTTPQCAAVFFSSVVERSKASCSGASAAHVALQVEGGSLDILMHVCSTDSGTILANGAPLMGSALKKHRKSLCADSAAISSLRSAAGSTLHEVHVVQDTHPPFLVYLSSRSRRRAPDLAHGDHRELAVVRGLAELVRERLDLLRRRVPGEQDEEDGRRRARLRHHRLGVKRVLVHVLAPHDALDELRQRPGDAVGAHGSHQHELLEVREPCSTRRAVAPSPPARGCPTPATPRPPSPCRATALERGERLEPCSATHCASDIHLSRSSLMGGGAAGRRPLTKPRTPSGSACRPSAGWRT